MRIIAGAFGGRRLHAPRGTATRPTADRVKEALFNILGEPSPRDGARFRVLDLFAGSGALGLEAISRGADEAVLVEQDRDAVLSAERNVSDLGLAAKVKIVAREVGVAMPGLDGKFDWVFVDPPYDRKTDDRARGGGALERVLRLLARGHVLAPDAVVIAEHSTTDEPEERIGNLVRQDHRRYGQTALSFYRLEAAP